MKVLFAGLGSVGQRHVRNLRQLSGDRLELLAYRVRGLTPLITPAMTIDRSRSVLDEYAIRVVDRLEDGLAEKPDAVFVCNPTSRHLATALAAIEAGCHVFVEKPLSDSNAGVDAVIDAAERRQLVAAVGYQMRWHPALLRARELLSRQAIGQVLSIRADMSEYLPNAHPYEDYRESYAARADLGGGVALCYIHEFDYLHWLFGRPRRVFAVGGRLGALDIDVEDTVSTTLSYDIEGRAMAAQLQHSFLPRVPRRQFEAVGECGTIRINFLDGSLSIETVDGTASETHACDRNQLFLDELRQFLDAVDGRPSSIVTLREGAESLRVALAARQSLATGEVVSL